MATPQTAKTFSDDTVTAELANAQATTADAVAASARANAAADQSFAQVGGISGAELNDQWAREIVLSFKPTTTTRSGGKLASATGDYRDGSGGTLQINRNGAGQVTSTVYTHAASGKTITFAIVRTEGTGPYKRTDITIS